MREFQSLTNRLPNDVLLDLVVETNQAQAAPKALTSFYFGVNGGLDRFGVLTFALVPDPNAPLDGLVAPDDTLHRWHIDSISPERLAVHDVDTGEWLSDGSMYSGLCGHRHDTRAPRESPVHALFVDVSPRETLDAAAKRIATLNLDRTWTREYRDMGGADHLGECKFDFVVWALEDEAQAK